MSAGLETKEACEKNEVDKKARAYEASASLTSGAVTAQCCSWSHCNFNATTFSLTDPSAPVLRQLEGILYTANLIQSGLSYTFYNECTNFSKNIFNFRKQWL